MFNKLFRILAALLLFCFTATAQQAVIPGDFADPSIIKVGDTYYAAGTSSEWAPHFPLFTSKDMVNWKQLGYVFSKKPEWTASSFWAPELFYHNKTFYVYYTARRKSDGVSCIGVATSTDPSKGFTDHGIVVEYGKEAIDGFVINDNGQLYISFKAYGLDKRPIEILCAKLSADGLKMEGEPFSLLRDDARIGLEGQVLIKWNNHYYLLYSAGGCCGIKCSYNVRVARASSIKGPFVNFESNPILTENDSWKCPGHGTIVQTEPNRYFYLYHAYSKKDDVFTGRQGLLNELVWKEYTGWPSFLNNKNASTKFSDYNIRDEFKNSPLANYWQWDFRHYQPKVKFEKDMLYLHGDTDTSNHTGTALTVRPVSGDYVLNTEVVNTNTSLKGLVLYGDANQSVGIGVTGNKAQVWEVKNNQRKILREQSIQSGPVHLRMVVKNGSQCQFYFGGKDHLTELKLPGLEYFDGKFLPPWDRSPRPGVFQYGDTNKPAAFSFFSITY